MKFLPERKKAETSKRNLGSLQILHCLFHCGALLLFLLRQKQLDLLLYAVKLLFFCIRERRVILQRKLTGIPDHGKLLIRKKALAFHKTGADGEVLLRGFIVFHEIMPSVDALPVKVPFPRHEPSALFAELPSQHRVTKIRKYLVGIFKANSFQRRRAFKDPHILLDLSSRLYYRPKLPIYFRPCDIRWSETDDAVSVNRAERLLFPSDVDQTVFQQLRVQFLAQKLLFNLTQKSFLLRCVFFALNCSLSSRQSKK